MIAFIIIGLAAAPDMSPIDIPYQIMPAYSAYTQCVSAHLRADPHFKSEDATLLRQANGDALAACRDVRRQQLAHAFELMTDYRLYGNRERAQAAVRRAFDRFDSDYAIEPIVGAAASPSQPQAQEDPVIKCAFDHARQLATTSSEAPEVIADEVVSACTPPENGNAAETGFTRSRVRVATIAMVKRLRGLDGQPADAPFRIPTEERTLQIPDEIAPAVVPYFECLLASAGFPLRHNGHVVPPVVAKGADCSPQRRLAASRADEMLRQAGGKNAAERRALIDGTLTSMDGFVAQMVPSPSAQKASDAPHQ